MPEKFGEQFIRPEEVSEPKENKKEEKPRVKEETGELELARREAGEAFEGKERDQMDELLDAVNELKKVSVPESIADEEFTKENAAIMEDLKNKKPEQYEGLLKLINTYNPSWESLAKMILMEAEDMKNAEKQGVSREVLKRVGQFELLQDILSTTDLAKEEKLPALAGFIEENNLQIDKVENLEKFLASEVGTLLVERKMVFSDDVKRANLSISEVIKGLPGPCLWGRERQSGLINITDLVTFGRGGERKPYGGWEYIAATRDFPEEELSFRRERLGQELNFEEAKGKIDYLKEQLAAVPKLEQRFEKLLRTFETWRQEGSEIEEKLGGREQLSVGAYARHDAELKLEKPSVKRADLQLEDYGDLHAKLDTGFKSASWVAARVKDGVEDMHRFISRNQEEFEKMKPFLNTYFPREKSLSEEEKESYREQYKEIFGPLRIMESVYNTPRGVYFSDPPLHGGAAGEEAPEWSERSYAFRDRAFYKTKEKGKDEYANVKEYHILRRAEEIGDDLKLRLYGYSSEPSPNKLGESGLTVEIERNGETKFLDEEEIKNLSQELKEYTLPTLYMKGSSILQV